MARSAINRERIVAATAQVIREKGVAGATTRAIVQAVPCAEGTLYLYFKHRTELLLAVIEEFATSFVEDLVTLPRYVGEGSVEDNLATIMRQAATFQDKALTLFCGVLSDPELLQAQQNVMRKARKGPQLSRLAIARYLQAEKILGRVPAELDSDLTAGLLLRASCGRVFEERFVGSKSASASSRQMKALIAALLAPRKADPAIRAKNKIKTPATVNKKERA